jgi:cytosine/adenosine deaminase-related metal-dependent hydrolase
MLLIRARVVLPLSQPVIPDGAVLVRGRRIAAVGRWRDLRQTASRRRTLDVGSVILLPGLVNAHCHLDYTDMAGQFPPPRLFIDWLKLITTAKGLWDLSDFAASWRHGAQMLLRTGTTTVADIEAMPELLPAAWQSTPLRVYSFIEMIGLTNRRRPEAILQEAVGRVDSLRSLGRPVGLSPHAPYTTLPELLRLNSQTASRRGWRVCTHLAESALEFEMFHQAGGEMFKWLRQSGRDMSDCGLGSPVQHLERCGLLGDNLLAAHANYLAFNDAALLGRRKVSVIHCPRCHSYFRHSPFPLRRLARAGVNVCLGTDSLASIYKSRRQVVELNMFEEMRALADRHPSISPRTILRMATLNGARALGLEGRIGELSQTAYADLVALPFAGAPRHVYDAILQHPGNVPASMINGKWALGPAQGCAGMEPT